MGNGRDFDENNSENHDANESHEEQVSKKRKKIGTETDLKHSIEALQQKVEKVDNEVRILEGQLKNRDPARTDLVKKENEDLRKRIKKLTQALMGMMLDQIKPRTKNDMARQYEALRKATIKFCQNSNIDENIWKKLAS